MTSSSATVDGVGKAGCEEIQRVREMGEGESVVC